MFGHLGHWKPVSGRLFYHKTCKAGSCMPSLFGSIWMVLPGFSSNTCPQGLVGKNMQKPCGLSFLWIIHIHSWTTRIHRCIIYEIAGTSLHLMMMLCFRSVSGNMWEPKTATTGKSWPQPIIFQIPEPPAKWVWLKIRNPLVDHHCSY